MIKIFVKISAEPLQPYQPCKILAILGTYGWPAHFDQRKGPLPLGLRTMAERCVQEHGELVFVGD